MFWFHTATFKGIRSLPTIARSIYSLWLALYTCALPYTMTYPSIRSQPGVYHLNLSA
jgi:hypothetical protein